MHTRRLVFFYAVLLFAMLTVLPLAVPVATGMVLAYVCEKPLAFLKHKMRISSPKATWLVSILFIFFILSVFIVPVVLSLYAASADLLHILDTQHKPPNFHLLQLLERFNVWLANKAEFYQLPLKPVDIKSRVYAAISGISEIVLNGLGYVLSGAPRVLFQLMMGLLSWIIFLIYGQGWRQTLLPLIIPWEEQRYILTQNTSAIIRGVIVANLVVSLVQALLIVIFLGVTGVPRYFLWGVLAFFLSYIPIVGTAPILVGGAIYQFSENSIASGVFLLLSVLIVGTCDNILRPFFLKDSVNIGFFWILISILGGVSQFGLAGVILGPLSFALFSASIKAINIHNAAKSLKDKTF